MISCDAIARTNIGWALNELSSHVGGLPQQIRQGLQADFSPTRSIVALLDEIQLLQNKIPAGNDPEPLVVSLSPDELSLLRAALSLKRRTTGARVLASQAAVVDPELADALSTHLQPLDALLSDDDLREVPPRRIPRLGDYLTRRGVEIYHPPRRQGVDEFDPKHKTLLSSGMIPTDTATYRSDCDERYLPFAIMFADLDEFKKFNTALGEVRVDQVVLPPVLRAVDSATFGHGRAYRHGGDEFVVLLPNASSATCQAIAANIRLAIETLHFPGTSLRASVSIGIWISVPDSHFTDAELIQQAALSKARAKDLGKKRTVIRTERASGYAEVVLEPFSPTAVA